MLGWHVSVYRQQDGGKSPATWESAEGACLAVWQTDWDGLKWFDDLVKAAKPSTWVATVTPADTRQCLNT